VIPSDAAEVIARESTIERIDFDHMREETDIVGYPILLLREDRRDLHRYLRDLEEVRIRDERDRCRDGVVTATSPIRHKVPVTEYLKLQKRYAHLFGNPPDLERIARIQAMADHNIDEYGLVP